MPSVYDYHHIELNNVGRGKKRISLTSSDGGIKGVLVTPTKDCNGVNGRHSVDGSMNGSNDSSPNSSRPASRRGSRSEDTKTKLFGPPIHNTPRKVKDLFKSSVFANEVTTPKSPQKISPPRATYTPVRRNPITGEILGTPSIAATKISSLPMQHEKSCGNGIKQNGNGSICSLSSISSIPSN